MSDLGHSLKRMASWRDFIMLQHLIRAARKLFNATFRRCKKPGCWNHAAEGSNYCSEHRWSPIWMTIGALLFIGLTVFLFLSRFY